MKVTFYENPKTDNGKATLTYYGKMALGKYFSFKGEEMNLLDLNKVIPSRSSIEAYLAGLGFDLWAFRTTPNVRILAFRFPNEIEEVFHV